MENAIDQHVLKKGENQEEAKTIAAAKLRRQIQELQKQEHQWKRGQEDAEIDHQKTKVVLGASKQKPLKLDESTADKLLNVLNNDFE